jgi:hypothetical protein
MLKSISRVRPVNGPPCAAPEEDELDDEELLDVIPLDDEDELLLDAAPLDDEDELLLDAAPLDDEDELLLDDEDEDEDDELLEDEPPPPPPPLPPQPIANRLTRINVNNNLTLVMESPPP